MRQMFTFVAVLIAGGIGFCVSSDEAEAGPVPAVSAPALAPTAIERAGYWRRNCRRYGCGPDVEMDHDVPPVADVPLVQEDLIILPPPRPLSCGEYRYWNGTACVDARYNTPYIGPK